MREQVEAYFKAAVARPVELAEMAIDLWYPMRRPGLTPARFLEEATPIVMEMVRDGIVLEVIEKDNTLAYYLKAHQDLRDKRTAERKAKEEALKNDHYGKPPEMAKNAPIIIH